MKILYTILVMLFSLTAICQNDNFRFRTDGNQLKFEYPPKVFLDSMLIPFDYVKQIKPNDIESISVVKSAFNSTTMTEGELYIKLKKGSKHNFFNFANFKANYLPNNAKPILLMLNSVFINDYSTFVIDKNTIALVEIDNGADINPIKNIYPNNTIVNILTKESFNRNSVSQILRNADIDSK